MLVVTERMVELRMLRVSFRDHVDNKNFPQTNRDHERKQNPLGGVRCSLLVSGGRYASPRNICGKENDSACMEEMMFPMCFG